ncbi:hypothetical protein RB195_016847 [Necator americanus]|uniref:Uncharacterized protein n=1 Tax=Necator americanus TaxID=51031 RepID=A0ABR1C2F8_NECAM
MTFLRYDLRERDRLATDLDSVLHRARVPLNQRRYIKDELFKELPVHATSNTEERNEVEKELLSNYS